MAARDPKAPLVDRRRPQRRPGRERRLEPPAHAQGGQPHAARKSPPWRRCKDSLGFIDLARAATPEPEKLFSWWSYRAADFRASNRGLRLDHIWVTPGLRAAAFHSGAPLARVHDDVRAWERPSDHAPVTADLVI